MRITFNAAKREKTLQERGLDFRRAKEAFEGVHLTRPDDRRDYGEQRYITAGWLAGKTHGRHRMDASRSRAPHHLNEESQ
jgi:uncharacterized DUF497 family protein